ncbi:MAG TPA: nitrous oxide-stimulated promoter family protein [Phycisphaerae bacterium]|nr:nitrous oxide-stimulated promoter family protein [Phycisphaerae bacterium]
MIQAADPLNESETATAHPSPRQIHLQPLAPGVKTKPNTPERRRRDVRTLTTFVRIYCHAQHQGQAPFVMKGAAIDEIAGKPLELCAECSKLLQHALVKRTYCPRDPKPDCKHCPTHCYAPRYRAQIREVMKFSGKRLFLRGRLDYLWHLFF